MQLQVRVSVSVNSFRVDAPRISIIKRDEGRQVPGRSRKREDEWHDVEAG